MNGYRDSSRTMRAAMPITTSMVGVTDTVLGVMAAHRSPRALSKAEGDQVRSALRILLQSHGTQVQLAKTLGFSQQVLSKILNGGDVGLYVARKVAKAAGVPYELLLSGGQTISPELEATIAKYPGRWSDAAIAAVRAVADRQQFTQATAFVLLDDVHAALSGIRGLPPDPTPSRPDLTAKKKSPRR